MEMNVELCKRCQRELHNRLSEAERAVTPIEMYASTEEAIMQRGCTYIINKHFQTPCRLACHDGADMCPRHDFLTRLEAQNKHQREQEAHAKKLAAQKKGKVAA
jgi:hypothetical protein